MVLRNFFYRNIISRKRTMDINEVFKRVKRIFDGYFSTRKAFLLVLVCVLLLLYILPSLLRFFFGSQSLQPIPDAASRSIALQLEKFSDAYANSDVHILHVPPLPEEKPFLPYVGNGYFGLSVDPDSTIFIRLGRTLSLPINYRPLVMIALEGPNIKEAIVTDYMSGVIHHFQSWEHSYKGPIDVSYQIYAHRTVPSLLFQDIKIVNPTNEDVILETERMGLGNWPTATTEVIKVHHGEGEHEYTVISGTLNALDQESVIAVTVVTLKIPSSIQVKSKMSNTLHLVTAVNYSEPVSKSDYENIKEDIKASAIKELKLAVTGNFKRLLKNHVQVWKRLWLSGFGISHSKAENAVNGDLINATIYNVLSQVPAVLSEETTSPENREALSKYLVYSEGCYGGHQTLEADKLWSTLNSIENINQVVAYWMVTLEKQDCHQLVRAGADGVMQAMLLSFGGLRFKNQHLEFTAHPKDLHRNYYFRRINYGNGTHLNITVIVQEEDYQAVIYVALDRSERKYYACDAGCLDPPVPLTPHQTMFPVKLTSPVTAILYVTSDKLHMEELKHTIHVKEIALAPPHEHHVISMHKHGHRWGGLPTLFWMGIVLLIVVFHLFLFKLIINEYCGDSKVRYRSFC